MTDGRTYMVRLVRVVPVPPTIRVEAQGHVVEGRPAKFRLRTNKSLPYDTYAILDVDTEGDFGFAASQLGHQVVHLRAGSTRAFFEVATRGDDVDEAHGSVTARLDSSPGFEIPEDGRVATVMVADDDFGDLGKSTVRIARGGATHVTEGEDAVFTLSAQPPPARELRVVVNVDSHGPGGDPGIRTGRHHVVKFHPGQRELAFRVPTTDDRTEERDTRVVVQVRCYDSARYGDCNPDFSRDTAEVFVLDNDGSGSPRVSIHAVRDVITEGEDAVFLVTANPAPQAQHTVNGVLLVELVPTLRGDFGVRSGQNPVSLLGGINLSLPVGQSSMLLTLSTEDDRDAETYTLPDGNVVSGVGSVTLDVVEYSGYLNTVYRIHPSQSRASVVISDNDGGPSSIRPPGTPAVARDGSSLVARWDAVEGAAEYEVHWGEASGEARETVRTGALHYATPALSPATQYAFSVSACNDNGECGEPSPEATGTSGTPPTANAGPDLEASPGERVTLQGKGSTNPHGRWYQMAHRWTQPEGQGITLSDATKGDPWFDVPADATPGTVYHFTLTVTDRDGERDSDAMTVTVPGTPPTANAGADVEAEPGETVRLDGAGSVNPHGRWWKLQYQWTQTGGPAVTLQNDDANAARLGIPPDRTGNPFFAVPEDAAPGTVYAFAMTVTDRDGEADSDDVSVTVRAASAPRIELTADAGPDVEAAPGETVTLGAAPEEDAADGLVRSWTRVSGPDAALADTDAAQAAFTVPADAADGAAWVFRLTVRDAHGNEAADDVRVTARLPALACFTDLGTLAAGAAAEFRGRWDDAECRAHHRAERPARYFRFTLAAPAAVSVDLSSAAGAAAFISRGTPRNGWGTPPRAGYAHRVDVRLTNGLLAYGPGTAARLPLEAGTVFTVEVVPDGSAPGASTFSVRIAAAALPALPVVSVADARASESDGEMVFRVTLDRPAELEGRVVWVTGQGSATTGVDFTGGAAELIFRPGEREKTVRIAIIDDAHDEGEETFSLRLLDPKGLRLGDALATGTIRNADPLLNAWLARFGRTVASQTVDALTERFAVPSGAGSHVTLGGQRIGLSPSGGAGTPRTGGPDGGLAAPGAAPGEGDAAQVLTALAAAGPGSGSGTSEGDRDGSHYSVIPGSPGSAQSRSMTGRELLLGSSFHLSAGGDGSGAGHGPRWTAWGRAGIERFENRDGGLPVDGEVLTGVFGADWERGGWLAGVALTHSAGEGGMRPRGMAMAYDLDSTLTAVNPYVRVRLSDRLSAWALAGYGQGDLTLTQRRAAADGGQGGRTTWKTDIAMTLGAAGARGALLAPEEADGFGLALRGDAFWVRTTSDAIRGVEGLGNLAAAEADASRVRLVLEGSRTMKLGADPGAGTLTPSLELGVRHDGGDAETGMGLELGGGVRYADPSSGVSMDLKARTLLAHAESGYREWGVSGALRIAPGAQGRGLTLTLTPAYGADAGGTDRLWSAGDAAALAPAAAGADPRGRLEAEVGYGLAAFDGGFTGTPYAGFGYSDTDRRYRLGWRLTRPAGAGAFAFSLEASRRESANDNAPVEHGIGFRFTSRW